MAKSGNYKWAAQLQNAQQNAARRDAKVHGIRKTTLQTPCVERDSLPAAMAEKILTAQASFLRAPIAAMLQ